MITTHGIKIETEDNPKKLKFRTTKKIEVEIIDKGEPQAPKGPIITTHNIQNFQKKKRVKKRAKKK